METKNRFESYEAPQMEIIEVAVESGFSTSAEAELEQLLNEEVWY